MACEDYDLAKLIAESIREVNKELIFLVPTRSQMEKAGKKAWNENCSRNIC